MSGAARTELAVPPHYYILCRVIAMNVGCVMNRASALIKRTMDVPILTVRAMAEYLPGRGTRAAVIGPGYRRVPYS